MLIEDSTELYRQYIKEVMDDQYSYHEDAIPNQVTIFCRRGNYHVEIVDVLLWYMNQRGEAV